MTPSDRDIHLATPSRLLDALAPVLVGVPVVILPWIFGGVQSAVQVWLLVGVIAALLVAIVSIRFQNANLILPAALIPLLMAVGLGGFQLVPLPQRVVQAVAPRNAELWKSQLGEPTAEAGAVGVASTEQVAADYLTVSLYPGSTRRDLALLGGAVALYAIGAHFLSRSTALVALLAVTAMNGAAVSFCGLALQLRPLTPADTSSQLGISGAHFATFVNKNHAGGYLNLALAGAIGLAIWSFARRYAGGPSTQNTEAFLKPRRAGASRHGAAMGGRGLLQGLSGWQVLSLSLVVAISAGVICSMSRGAWVAAICAAVVTVYATGVGNRAGWRKWLLFVPAGLGLALVLWMGQGNQLSARWGTLWTQLQTPDGRFQHWRDALCCVPEFWSLGSGLGTYRYVYLLHSTTPASIWFYHAENQYLEAAVEGGWLGLTLVLALLVLSGLACRKLLAEPPSSLSYALGACAVFALVSQVVHSGFDFGLYIPSNMALFALLMGSAGGLAAQLSARQQALARRDLPRELDQGTKSIFRSGRDWQAQLIAKCLTLRMNKVTAATLVCLLTVAMAFAVVETGRAAHIERAGQGMDLRAMSRSVPPVGQLANIARLERASGARADDAEAHQKLAELWLLSCRTKLVVKWKQSWGAATDVDALWQHSAPVELHGWAAALTREKRDWELVTLRQSEEIQDDLQRAARHLLQARESCPLLPRTHLLLAELTPFIPWLGDEEGHLTRMRNLISRDDRLLMESGFVEFQSGRADNALADWKRVAEHSPQSFLPQILEYAVQSPELTSEIEKLLPDDPASLVELAKSRFAGPEGKTTRERLLARASQLLATADATPERHYLEGMILSLEENSQPAIEQLTKAVELRPEQINWRYDLALALQKAGKLEAAHEQARLCWSFEPSNEHYERLFRQLVRMQLTTR